ncbi:hypothetical protein D3C72_1566520 [compost metagenome]
MSRQNAAVFSICIGVRVTANPPSAQKRTGSDRSGGSHNCLVSATSLALSVRAISTPTEATVTALGEAFASGRITALPTKPAAHSPPNTPAPAPSASVAGRTSHSRFQPKSANSRQVWPAKANMAP